MNLTSSQNWLIGVALRCWADTVERGLPREIVDQKQLDDARKLAGEFENADTVTIL